MSHGLKLCQQNVHAFEKDVIVPEYVIVCAIVLLAVQAKACPRHGGQLGV